MTKQNKTQENECDEAVSPVIGVILMVAITVALAAAVFVMVGQLSEIDEQAPEMLFSSGNDTATLRSADTGLDWSDFAVSGCSGVPAGAVTAGDRLTGCSGYVSVSYKPLNALVYDHTF